MKKFLTLTLTLLLLLLMLCSCSAPGKGDYSGSYDAPEAMPGDDYYEEVLDKENGAGVTTGGEITGTEQKLITTVSMTLESKNYDELTGIIYDKLAEAGGYVEKSEENARYNSLRFATYTLRVPADNLTNFLESIKGSANVLNQSMNTVDVTLTYADLEGRLSSLRAEQQALNGMLEKASSVSESITIQDRLSKVRGEIESIERQLRALSSKVSYSTVTLSVSEVKVETVIEPVEKNVWQRIAEDFTENAKDVGEYFADLFVGVIGSSPVLFAIAVTIILFLIPPALFVLIIVLIVKKAKKKKAKKTAQ